MISNGKSYCCNDTFTGAQFTLLLAKNVKEEYKLFYAAVISIFISYFVRNFHSNWLLFLRVMQENRSGCVFF